MLQGPTGIIATATFFAFKGYPLRTEILEMVALMSTHPSGPHRTATRHNKRDMQSPGGQHWRDAWLKISGLWTVLRSSGTLRDCNFWKPFQAPNKWHFYWNTKIDHAWPHIVCHEVSMSIQYLKQLFLYPPGLCLAALVSLVLPSSCYL